MSREKGRQPVRRKACQKQTLEEYRKQMEADFLRVYKKFKKK